MQIKNIILGFGIGIIITATVIFWAYSEENGALPREKTVGNEPVATPAVTPEPEIITVPIDLTDDEIIDRARELDMILASEAEYHVSDRFVISRAGQLGMVFPHTNTDEQAIEASAPPTDEGAETDNQEPETQTTLAQSTATPTATASGKKGYARTENNRFVLGIEKGMTLNEVSDLMEKAGIIDSAKSFSSYLAKAKLEMYVMNGEFNIPFGSGYDDLVYLLTGRKIKR